VRLMSLHPPMVRSRLTGKRCRTCYEEEVSMQYAPRKATRKRRYEGAGATTLTGIVEEKPSVDAVQIDRENRGRRLPDNARQLATRDKSAFQLDGNLGLVAATNEMLLQSHLPGTLALLPALPTKWAGHGSALGLGARGDAVVSMRWLKGKVTAAKIVFNSPHPWLASAAGLRETGPGYFAWRPEALEAARLGLLQVRIVSPLSSDLVLVSSKDALGATCAISTGGWSFKSAYDWIAGRKPILVAPAETPLAHPLDAMLLEIKTAKWPCQVVLCSRGSGDCEVKFV